MGNPQLRILRSAHYDSPRCDFPPATLLRTALLRTALDMAVAPSALVEAASLCAPATLSVPVRRIATFHLNGLSDLLFTLPALHALREGFPGARLHAVVRPALIPLLRDSPLVDEVLPRPKGGLSEQTALMLQLRARHIDLAVAFSPSRNTTMLAWSSGAATRVGFASARMEALLTHRVCRQDTPEIEAYLDLARALGCAARQRDYRGLLAVSPTAQRSADRLLNQFGVGDPFIVAACETGHVPSKRAPNGRHGIRQWPAAHWAAALDELAAHLPVVLVGTQPSPAVTEMMRRPVADTGGRVDLPGLAALCGRARLFVGSDGGAMHLAASLGTPVIGIFGPSDWLLTGPRGVPHRIVRHPVECSPCLLSRCKWTGDDERKCLTRLEPRAVVEAARELIGV